MKFLMFCAVAALIFGGIYHTEVAEYFAELNNGSSGSGGGSFVGAMRDMGSSGNDLMGGVGGALGR